MIVKLQPGDSKVIVKLQLGDSQVIVKLQLGDSKLIVKLQLGYSWVEGRGAVRGDEERAVERLQQPEQHPCASAHRLEGRLGWISFKGTVGDHLDGRRVTAGSKVEARFEVIKSAPRLAPMVGHLLWRAS